MSPNASLDRREFLRLGAGAALTAAAAPWLSMAAFAEDDFSRLDALGQAELVRGGAASARELALAAIRRIEKLHPVLNAVVATDFERALERCLRPLPDGPFTGVPFLLKDLEDYQGVRYTSGSVLFRDRVGSATPELTRRMEATGLVVLGKTNTPEFGLLPGTEPKLFGPARNPWDSSFDPGGSSGGAAVSVASGMVPMADGGDGGGSIRVPSSNCGLFGIKVSRGRQPEPALRPVDLAVRHVLTRSVRDSAAMLQATALSHAEGSRLPPPLAPSDRKPRRLRIACHTTDLTGVRTGRASPALVDRLKVEHYGTTMPLNQLATISAPEPRLLASRHRLAVDSVPMSNTHHETIHELVITNRWEPGPAHARGPPALDARIPSYGRSS